MTTAETRVPVIDAAKAEQLAIRVVGDVGGANIVALASIGDKLGLFRTLGEMRSATSQELAERAGLNERYVREWLRAMVASEYLDYDPAAERYVMTPEQAMVLADESSPLFCGGAIQFTPPTIAQLPRIVDAFRRGGGVPYHEMDAEVPCAIERLFRPGYVNFLVNEWLPAIPGLVERLRSGIDVLDIGCGRGQSTIVMAKAFPQSRFTGVDYHRESIAAANQLAADEGASNVVFRNQPIESLHNGSQYQLVCSFDCIHDMVDPDGALAAIRAAMAENAVWLWSEPNASHAADENRNPIGRMFHSVSPLHCMTISLAYGGAGLGTVIGEKGARELAKRAGFSSFERAPIQNPFNQFFVVRK